MGTKLSVGLDEHEIQMHAKFNYVENSNQHKFLLNFTAGGKVVDNDQVHYLTFEVIPFDENVEIITSSVNHVRKRLVKQYFRKWVHVANLKEINVEPIRVDGVNIFISDTRYFLPCWLQEEPIEYNESFNELPDDEPLIYGPEPLE